MSSFIPTNAAGGTLNNNDQINNIIENNNTRLQKVFLNESGDFLKGDLDFNLSNTITNIRNPINDGDGVNKRYFDESINKVIIKIIEKYMSTIENKQNTFEENIKQDMRVIEKKQNTIEEKIKKLQDTTYRDEIKTLIALDKSELKKQIIDLDKSLRDEFSSDLAQKQEISNLKISLAKVLESQIMLFKKDDEIILQLDIMEGDISVLKKMDVHEWEELTTLNKIKKKKLRPSLIDTEKVCVKTIVDEKVINQKCENLKSKFSFKNG